MIDKTEIPNRVPDHFVYLRNHRYSLKMSDFLDSTESECSSYHSDGNTTYRSFLGLSKASTSESFDSEDGKGKDSRPGSFPCLRLDERQKLISTNFDSIGSDHATLFPDASVDYMNRTHPEILNGLLEATEGRPTIIFICSSLRQTLNIFESQNKPKNLIFDVFIFQAGRPSIVVSIYRPGEKPDVFPYTTKVARGITAKIRTVVPNFNMARGVLPADSRKMDVVKKLQEWEAEALSEFKSRSLNLDNKRLSLVVQHLAKHLEGQDVFTSKVIAREPLLEKPEFPDDDAVETGRTVVSASGVDKKMQTVLKQKGVLMITGLPGSGKTETVKRLGAVFTKQGYQLKDVTDISTFDVEDYVKRDEKYFCVFDDIFENAGDLSIVEKILNSLTMHRYAPGTVYKPDQKVLLVFTSRTYNLRKCTSDLIESSVFPSHTIFDLSEIGFTGIDARDMFLMHWKRHKSKPPEESDLIFVTDKGPNVAGFPLMCHLYFGTDHSLSCKEFFDDPIRYFQTIFDQIINSESSLFGSLLCVFMCDNDATSRQEDYTDSGFKDSVDFRDTPAAAVSLSYKPFGELIAKLRQILPNINIEDAKQGIQLLNGIYVNDKKSTFLSSVIYDAFAYSLFSLYPFFVLENCRLTFLCKRLSGVILSTPRVDDKNSLCVSKTYLDVIANRLTNAILEGKLKLALSHPFMHHETFVDNVFKDVKLERLNSPFDDEKHYIYWTVKSNSTPLVKKVIGQVDWGPDNKRRQCIEAAMSSGCQEYTRGIVTKERSVINSCLFLAVELNCLDIAEYLLDNRANVLDVNWEGCNVFHVACLNNFEEMFEAIIRSCNTEVLNKALQSRDSKNRTPLTVTLEHGNKKIFDHLLLVGGRRQLKEAVDPFLHLACKGGNRDIVDELLKTFDVNVKDTSKATPLMMAALTGRAHLVDNLLARGADISMADCSGDQVIHYASRGGCVQVVMTLLTVCDQNTPGSVGLTPLMISAAEGNNDVFQYLVDHKADLSLTDQKGNVLIHHACRGGNIDIVKKVLAANVNARGERGRTPAMIAAAHKHVEVLDFLLSQNANLSEVDEDNNTVIDIGLSTKDQRMINFIRVKVSKLYKDAQGRSPLMSAALNADVDSFNSLMVDNSNLEQRDNDFNTVLHYACRGGSMDIVKTLLINNWDMDRLGAKNKTPLMFAAAGGHLDLVKFLITDKRADINRVDLTGNNVLHHACISGNVGLVEYLLPRFQVDLMGENNWTPIMMSVVYGHDSLFEYLKTNGANVNHRDRMGYSCSDLACIYNRENCFLKLCTNRNAQASIELSALYGNWDIFCCLLTLRFDGMVVTLDFNDKVFWNACHGGNVKMVQYILKHEPPNLDSRDGEGRTGLMIAALCGHNDVFLLLLKEGSQLNFEFIDLDGNNVLHLALIGGNKSIVEKIFALRKNKRFTLEDASSSIFAHWYAR